MDDEYPTMFREYLLASSSNSAESVISGSEQMTFVQVILPTEIAHDAVYELGELGNVQFEDVCCHCFPQLTLLFTTRLLFHR